MGIHRSNDPANSDTRRRVGTHRAPTQARWRWILGIVLPLAVLTGAGIALAELPDSSDPPVDAHGVGDTRPLTSDDGPSSEPSDSAIVTQPAETPDSSPSESTPSDPSGEAGADEADGETDSLAAEATALTNRERQAAGCADVTENAQLASAATDHSRDMADNGYFDHTSQDGRTFVDRAVNAGYEDVMSENIAKGYQDAASVIQGWMDSPGHRENLLNCEAQVVGIGVARDADGTLLWTQMFGRR